MMMIMMIMTLMMRMDGDDGVGGYGYGGGGGQGEGDDDCECAGVGGCCGDGGDTAVIGCDDAVVVVVQLDATEDVGVCDSGRTMAIYASTPLP